MLLPHVVEAGSLIQQLAEVGKKVFPVVGEDGEEAAFIFCRPSNSGLAGDASFFGGVHESDAEATHFIDQTERKGLLAGPDLASGEGLDLVVGGVTGGGHVVNELSEHVIDKGLKVGLFLWGKVAAGVAGVLQFA